MKPPPWLVLGVGNASRGDDALGPLLLERLRDAGVEAAGDVELLEDFQLQLEHALDLRDRLGVLFVDAARPGHADGASLSPIDADAAIVPASHGLRPQAVLHVARRIDGKVPPAWLLAIEGVEFGLGVVPSAAARRHLEDAVVLARGWLQARRLGAAA